MPRYALTIEYDGTGYAGWQRQNDAPSVQQTIEEACDAFCRQQVNLVCAGRTDAGVHAFGQVAHVDIAGSYDAFRVQEALNAHLRGKGIAILNAEQVREDFNARFDAVRRHYLYRIINRRSPLVLEANRAWQLPYALDIDAMKQAAQDFIGHHDFSSFRDAECQAKSPMRTLEQMDIHLRDERIDIRLSAPSFLHHQVRIMVGTLVEIGRGKRGEDSVPALFAAKSRKLAGVTAPACGLYFVKVDYPVLLHKDTVSMNNGHISSQKRHIRL